MFLPRRLKQLNRNASGSDSTVVFRYGAKQGRFEVGPIAHHLCLRPDASDHGNVEPSVEMDFPAFQAALHATREGWVDGEND